MKNFTFLCAAMLAASGTAFAADNVSEVTNSRVANAIEKCNGNGIFDVFILSEDAIQTIKKAEGITLNNYRCGTDQTTTIEGGGNIGWTSSYTVPGLDNNDSYGSFVIDGSKCQWWAGMYVKSNAGTRDFSHINKDTHIHVAIWTDSQILCDSRVKVHFLKNDGADAGAAQVNLCSNPDDPDAALPIVGSLQAGKWVALDMTYGEIAALMEEEFDMPLDYSRFTNSAAMVEMMGFEPPAGQDGADASEAKCDKAKFCVDAFYLYTPKGSGSGISDISGTDNNQIIVGDKTINTTGSEGIELYNASGMMVKKTSDNILATQGMPAGIYIAKAGKKTLKVVIK